MNHLSEHPSRKEKSPEHQCGAAGPFADVWSSLFLLVSTNRSGTLAAFRASGFRYQTGRLKLVKWVVSVWCPLGLHFPLAESRFDPFSLELKIRTPLSGEGGCANQNHRSANAPAMWPSSGGEEQRGRGWPGLGGLASRGGRVASLSPAARGLLLAGPSHLGRADGCFPTRKGRFPGAALAFWPRSLELMNS